MTFGFNRFQNNGKPYSNDQMMATKPVKNVDEELLSSFDPDNPYSMLLDQANKDKGPEYDQKRQDVQSNRAKFNVLGQALTHMGDAATLGMGGRAVKRDKGKQGQYIDNFLAYNDEFQKRTSDWETKNFLQKLKATDSIVGKDNADRSFVANREDAANMDEYRKGSLGQGQQRIDESIRSGKEGEKDTDIRNIESTRHNKRYEDYLFKSLEARNGKTKAVDFEDTPQGRQLQMAYDMAQSQTDFKEAFPDMFKREPVYGGEDGEKNIVGYNYLPNEGVSKKAIASAFMNFLDRQDYLQDNRGDSGMSFPVANPNNQAEQPNNIVLTPQSAQFLNERVEKVKAGDRSSMIEMITHLQQQGYPRDQAMQLVKSSIIGQ